MSDNWIPPGMARHMRRRRRPAAAHVHCGHIHSDHDVARVPRDEMSCHQSHLDAVRAVHALQVLLRCRREDVKRRRRRRSTSSSSDVDDPALPAIAMKVAKYQPQRNESSSDLFTVIPRAAQMASSAGARVWCRRASSHAMDHGCGRRHVRRA